MKAISHMPQFAMTVKTRFSMFRQSETVTSFIQAGREIIHIEETMESANFEAITNLLLDGCLTQCQTAR